MKTWRGAAYGAALFLLAAARAAASLSGVAHPFARPPAHPHGAPLAAAPRPWVEGVTPLLENRLFDATYRCLPSHNVLKVYAFDTNGYESAGIRFSARVAHEQRDMSLAELDREAVTLVKTTFEDFPEVQSLDVWATIPIPTGEQTQLESTLFSLSADRATYESVRGKAVSDQDFLAAFGQVWIAPEVPR